MRARRWLARALGELADAAPGPAPAPADVLEPSPPRFVTPARWAPTPGVRSEDVEGTAPFVSLGTLVPDGTLGTDGALGTDGTETLGTEGAETEGTDGTDTEGTLTESDRVADSRGAVPPSGSPPKASAPAATRTAIDTAAATSEPRAVLGIPSLPARSAGPSPADPLLRSYSRARGDSIGPQP
jgi:hypothetical protein